MFFISSQSHNHAKPIYLFFGVPKQINMAIDTLELLRAVSKDKKRTAAVIVGGLALVSLFAGLFGQFVILMLVIVAMALAFFLGEFEIKKIGLEFVTLTVVLAGFVYGPFSGAMLGVVLLILHFILTRSLGPYVIYCVPAMGLIGLLAGWAAAGSWFGGNIATIGIALSLAYNLITGALGSLILQDFFEEFLWSGTNFALNFVLFARFAPIILSAMV